MDTTKAYTVQSAIEEIRFAHADPNYKGDSITLYNIQHGCAQRVRELLSDESIICGDPILFHCNQSNRIPSATFTLAKK